jgi:hypothetical protein
MRDLLSRIARTAGLGLLAGVLAPTAAVVLSALGLNACFDSPAFFYTTPLVHAGLAVALMTASAAALGAEIFRGVALRAMLTLVLLIGVVLLADVLTGPPYHSCGQFVPNRPVNP